MEGPLGRKREAPRWLPRPRAVCVRDSPGENARAVSPGPRGRFLRGVAGGAGQWFPVCSVTESQHDAAQLFRTGPRGRVRGAGGAAGTGTPSAPSCQGEVALQEGHARRPFSGGLLAIKSQTQAEVLTPSKYTLPSPERPLQTQAGLRRCGHLTLAWAQRLPSGRPLVAGGPTAAASPSSPTHLIGVLGFGPSERRPLAHWRLDGARAGPCLIFFLASFPSRPWLPPALGPGAREAGHGDTCAGSRRPGRGRGARPAHARGQFPEVAVRVPPEAAGPGVGHARPPGPRAAASAPGSGVPSPEIKAGS